ncbi:hypothetical protein GX50_00422 [[Emmonsia] crescens]|uniref:Gag1-like clamp domain-containing protein n=1 Tax=[Emmonsia] crescens TaxID=73230 RepID=A0A2B7ZUU7_9EURO|nr:hypothetical protein GX50_00422 [Emmonsia crescens]
MDLTQPDEPPSYSHASSVFASLHRKPRPAPSGGPHGATGSLEAREAAIKSAKRYLLKTIRDDWTYERQSATPTSEPKHVHMQSQPQSPMTCGTSDGALQIHAREVREWREREQDSSCSETAGGVRIGGIASGQRSLLTATSTTSDPYRFESPDAVEDSILERKRKRRGIVEEELLWNEGLRIWMERRDAWTGARLPTSAAGSQGDGAIMGTVGSSEGSGAGSRIYEESEDVDMVSPDSTAQGDAPSRPLSSSSAKAPQIANAQILSPSDSLRDMGVKEATSPINIDDDNNNSIDANQPHFPQYEEPLIPVVEPLLPITNPVRASIKPSIYPSIYSKVVIQSLTPAIPINLSDVTKALVQGWKADGEWPPKPTATQDVPVVKKRSGNNPTVEDAGKSRRLSGSSVTGAVKKVLGLSGIHSGRRFHIRGGSHGGAGAGAGAGAGSTAASGAVPNKAAEAH